MRTESPAPIIPSVALVLVLAFGSPRCHLADLFSGLETDDVPCVADLCRAGKFRASNAAAASIFG